MIKETKPDCVIVTCPDGFHDEYIVRALDAGCDVHHREAADDHAREGAADRRRLQAQQPPRARAVQLPLFAAAHAGEGPADEQRHRRRDVGGFPLAAEHAARRRLFPPLAQPQGNLRRADDPQGHASLRSRELVVGQRAGDRAGLRQARVLHAGDGEAHSGWRATTSAASPAPRRPSARSIWTSAPTRTSRSCISTTRSTTAISATAACSGPTSTSKTR